MPIPVITPDPDLASPPAFVASARATEDGPPPLDEDTMPAPAPAPISTLAPAAPTEASYFPATLQTSAPRGNAMAWLAGLSGVPSWVLVFLALTPWGQRMMGMEDPAQGRAATIAEVRRETGAEVKAGLDGLRAELARDREAHEREHALEEKGVERELGAMREEMRLLREALGAKRR